MVSRGCLSSRGSSSNSGATEISVEKSNLQKINKECCNNKNEKIFKTFYERKT